MKTLFDKVWDTHVVSSTEDGVAVLYIDHHLIHEVTSPQAFAELEKRGIALFRPSKITATADHNVATINQHLPIKDDLSRFQVEKLTENCEKYGVELYGLGHIHQGIVHVIGPELGITQPGMTIVCGDSHTSTHGAFGSIAFGIGTSQVAMVMATQCLMQAKPKKMRVNVNGELQPGVSPKDIVLYIISKLSANGGSGHFVEFSGNVFRQMSMEGRMTVCNMSIEMGARGGMIAPDETTIEYVRNRDFAPKGDAFEKAATYWRTLKTDTDAVFDLEYTFNAEAIAPMITYGTNPGMAIPIRSIIPSKDAFSGIESFNKALDYMGLQAGELLLGKAINYVFIGSCTNARIEDLRVAASVVKGRRKADNVHAFIVPGSKMVQAQAKAEGLDRIFEAAGFLLREPGCSACLAMNDDKIPAGEYCVSTSNRNFEGRQGPGARTFLAGPLIAAVAAIEGKIADPLPYLELNRVNN